MILRIYKKAGVRLKTDFLMKIEIIRNKTIKMKFYKLI
jgi:hypothetical protein